MDASAPEVFDVVVVGTGLTESILSAALSKSSESMRVLHIDTLPYYGDREASLSASELHSLPFSESSTNGSVPQDARAFSLALTPSLLPSNGALIDALVESGVSRYTSFKLLDSTYIYGESGGWQEVPTSKASIFSSTLAVKQKRKLMRIIQMLSGSDGETLDSLPEVGGKEEMGIIDYLTLPTLEGGSFELDREVAESVAFTLGFCSTPSDPTLPVLRRIQGYIKSAGRYGDSPFLVGYYGGLGEIAQGFCRMAAVHGATYILGHKILSMRFEESSWRVELEGVPDILQAKVLIAGSRHFPNYTKPPTETGMSSRILRCVAIFGAKQQEENNTLDTSKTALRIFPPSGTETGAGENLKSERSVCVLVSGSDTMACPSAYVIAHLQTEATGSETSKGVLEPYVLSIAEGVSPIYSVFYESKVSSSSPQSQSSPPASNSLMVTDPPLSSRALPDVGDSHAVEAERLYREAMRLLRRDGIDSDAQGDGEGMSMWPPREVLEDDG